MSVGKRLRKLLGLSRRELVLLAEAQVLLVAAQVRVWLRPVGSLVVPCEDRGAAGAGDSQLAEARSAHRAVIRAADNGLFRPACLVRSLALQRMLERRGVEGGEVCVGVRLRGGGFGAHAWLELGGVVFDDDQGQSARFEALDRLELVRGR